MNFYFTYEYRDILESLTLFITVKTITRLNLGHGDKFEIEFKKLAVEVHVLQTTQNLELTWSSHLLFCRGRERNVPRIITQVHSHCSAHTILFCDVPVAVAVVVFLNSLINASELFA